MGAILGSLLVGNLTEIIVGIVALILGGIAAWKISNKKNAGKIEQAEKDRDWAYDIASQSNKKVKVVTEQLESVKVQAKEQAKLSEKEEDIKHAEPESIESRLNDAFADFNIDDGMSDVPTDRKPKD